MLDIAVVDAELNTSSNIADLLRQSIWQLEVPASGRHLLEGEGPSSSFDGDERRHVRVRKKCWGAIRHQTSLPAIPRLESWHAILVLNLSKSGLGFLHSAQLFPTERLVVCCGNLQLREIQIASCRRIGSRCYLIGAAFGSRSAN